MMTRDFGLRYVSPRRWCWRANDGSWRDVPKWSAKLYLAIECGLADKQSTNAAMKEAIENFQVDIVGDYRFDKKIYDRVNRFGHNLPIDGDGSFVPVSTLCRPENVCCYCGTCREG